MIASGVASGGNTLVQSHPMPSMNQFQQIMCLAMQQQMQTQQNMQPMMQLLDTSTSLPGFKFFGPGGGKPLGTPMRRAGSSNAMDTPPNSIGDAAPDLSMDVADVGDLRDDLDAVKQRMLNRKRKVPDQDEEKEVEEDEESEVEQSAIVAVTPGGRKKRGQQKSSKKKAKSKAKGSTDFETTVNSDDFVAKPNISIERSRSQVMCRSGKQGPGSTKKFTFEEYGSQKKAMKAAQAWLSKKTYLRIHTIKHT